MQPPTAAPNAALQEQRETWGSRELAFPQGLGSCSTWERVLWSHRQGHLHYPSFDCTRSTHIQSAVTPFPFSIWARREMGTYLPVPGIGPTSQGAVDGTGWGLPTLPTPPAIPWTGAVGCSKERAGLTWTAHSALSLISPRCLAASPGPAASPRSPSPADSLQEHRESITPPLLQKLENTGCTAEGSEERSM